MVRSMLKAVRSFSLQGERGMERERGKLGFNRGERLKERVRYLGQRIQLL